MSGESRVSDGGAKAKDEAIAKAQSRDGLRWNTAPLEAPWAKLVVLYWYSLQSRYTSKLLFVESLEYDPNVKELPSRTIGRCLVGEAAEN